MFSPESSHQPEQPLVQAVLEPLLDDFQYWFSETAALLESPKAACIDMSERQALADQITEAQREVATARTLMLATEGSAGVDVSLVGKWHQLVSRCWQTARKIRQQNQRDRES